MPVQYEGVRAEHLAVRSTCGIFDVSHMGEIEVAGPQAAALLQRLLSNDLDKLEVGGAQYSVLCNEDGGVLDDLFTYRLGDGPLPHGDQRRQPREGPRLVPPRTPSPSTPRSPTAPTRTRCSPSRARSRARSSRPSPTRRCPSASRSAAARLAGQATCSSAARATRARTASSCCWIPPTRVGDLGRRRCAAARVPVGLAARDTLRLEVCYHLYGNDLMESTAARSRPASAGRARRPRASSAPTRSRAVRAAGAAEKLVPFKLDRARASPARATRSSAAAR